MRQNRYSQDFGRAAIAGALGGLIGTFAMDRFQGILARVVPGLDSRELVGSFQGEQRSKIEQDEPATVKAGGYVLRAITGRRAGEAERRAAGTALHYLYGATAGAAHGLMTVGVRRPSVAKGIAMGLGVWLIADETVTPALGIAPKPWESSPGAHALAAAAHVVYGATTELARRAIQGRLGELGGRGGAIRRAGGRILTERRHAGVA